MFQRLRAIFGMPGAEPAPAGITSGQGDRARALGFTLRHDVDRAEYRLRPVGAADDQAYYARDLADELQSRPTVGRHPQMAPRAPMLGIEGSGGPPG